MCLSKTSLYSCNSVTNSQQSWCKTSTQQCSGLHSEQEGFGVWFPPKAFYVWQRFPPGSQVPQFKDTRWQLRTVCRSLSVNGCLSLLVALQCTGHWSGAQPNFAPRQLGETPWQPCNPESRRSCDRKCMAGNKSNQAKPSLKSSSPVTYAAAV